MMGSPRPPQFNLRWIFTRTAVVASVIAATMWWVNHVRRVAEYGPVPLGTMRATIFLVIILVGAIFTVVLMPLMSIAVAMLWPRRRPNKKDASVSE